MIKTVRLKAIDRHRTIEITVKAKINFIPRGREYSLVSSERNLLIETLRNGIFSLLHSDVSYFNPDLQDIKF